MDVLAVIVIALVAIIIVGLAILYIYDRGYHAGYAVGQNADPYKIVTQGWELVLPDNKGSIKLIPKEADHG